MDNPTTQKTQNKTIKLKRIGFRHFGYEDDTKKESIGLNDIFYWIEIGLYDSIEIETVAGKYVIKKLVK